MSSSQKQFNPDQLAEFKEVFASVDKDRDGSITTQELAQALRSMSGSLTDAEVQRIVGQAGAKLSLNDF